MTSRGGCFPALAALLLAAVFAPPTVGAPELDEKARCARIDARLDRLQSELRAGYTAKRGRKLKELQRVLEEQRRTECR